MSTGVVGLTTAVKIQERGGYHVTVIAETFPTDPKNIKYTSIWAVRVSCFALLRSVLNMFYRELTM